MTDTMQTISLAILLVLAGVSLCDSGLVAWGSNFAGQAGQINTTALLFPVPVVSDLLAGKTITQIGCGTQNSAVLTSEQRMYTWGAAYGGQIGDGFSSPRYYPVAISTRYDMDGKKISQFVAGDDFFVVLTSKVVFYLLIISR